MKKLELEVKKLESRDSKQDVCQVTTTCLNTPEPCVPLLDMLSICCP
ncbi:MAG: hypothetical protein SVM80_05245 [Halobacteriota archaeon]|nr:hypothetical protein [Halobacteriota archaeon]